MIDVNGTFTQDDDSESTLSVCTDSTETVCDELEFQFREEEIALSNDIYSEDFNFDSPCDSNLKTVQQNEGLNGALSVCTDSTETVCDELEFQYREEEMSLSNDLYSEDAHFDSHCGF